MIGQGLDSSQGQMLACPHPVPPDRRSKPHPNMLLKCPRCESLDTKFCYYNNYSLTQPRYFCKHCKRYWTDGGALRNVPVGGGLRKNKRSKQKAAVQGDVAAAAKSGLSVCNDTVSKAKSHSASLNESSLTTEPTKFGYTDSVQGNYSFDKSRTEHHRGYEAVEQASLSSTLSHFSYGEELRHAARFYPGYGYSHTPVEEVGLPQYEAANYGYNLLDQRQSSREEMTEVQEEKASCSNRRSEQHHHQGVQQPLNLLEPEEEDDDEEDENQGYAAKTRKLLPSCNELELADKSANKFGNQDAACDEANSGVVNPYDWQQISEGLFTGNLGDFFYLPGGSWPDWSNFDSGPG